MYFLDWVFIKHYLSVKRVEFGFGVLTLSRGSKS